MWDLQERKSLALQKPLPDDWFRGDFSLAKFSACIQQRSTVVDVVRASVHLWGRITHRRLVLQLGRCWHACACIRWRSDTAAHSPDLVRGAVCLIVVRGGQACIDSNLPSAGGTFPHRYGAATTCQALSWLASLECSDLAAKIAVAHRWQMIAVVCARLRKRRVSRKRTLQSILRHAQPRPTPLTILSLLIASSPTGNISSYAIYSIPSPLFATLPTGACGVSVAVSVAVCLLSMSLYLSVSVRAAKLVFPEMWRLGCPDMLTAVTISHLVPYERVLPCPWKRC